MKELISKPLDVLDEILAGNIEYIADVVGRIPDERVKTAYIPTVTEQAELDDDKVALILFNNRSGEIKKFANHTPELTMLNLEVLKDKIASLPEEVVTIAATNLTAAADEFKLSVPTELKKYAAHKFVDNVLNVDNIETSKFIIKQAQLRKKRAAVKYASLQPDDFAIPAKRLYPIPDPWHMKVASEYFAAYHKEMPVEDRVTFSVNLKKKGMCSDEIDKYANYDVATFNSDFVDNIKSRQRFLDGREDLNLYDELVKRAEEFGPLKTAALLDTIDKKLGADKGYHRFISEPLDSVLSIKKEATLKIDERVIDRNYINDLASIDKVDDLLDEHVKQELKGPDGLAVFSSLPLPIREALYRLVEGGAET